MSEEFSPRPQRNENPIPAANAFKGPDGHTSAEYEHSQVGYQFQSGAADASLDSQEAAQIVNEAPAGAETRVSPSETVPVQYSKPPKSFWREVLETVILTILIFFLAESVIQPFRIQGSSMDPTFRTDQLLMVNKAAYFHFDINPWLRLIPGVKAEGSHTFWVFGGPQRGDVVVFEYPRDPSQDYIKRVIGLPGEKVEIKGGVVYVNDKALNEPYIKEAPLSPYGPQIVPPDSLFVLGDNRNGSSDSRAWGFLPIDRIIGKAMVVYWPIGKGWGLVSAPSYK